VKKNLSLGPKFNTLFNKAEQEAMTFKNSLSELNIKMDDNSPSVQLSSAGFDKAIDELKQEIANSLNEWVNLQNDIKKEVSDLANCNWINPLKSFK